MMIGTIASHSALQILRGAKDEGFETLLISDRERRGFYERFKVADELIEIGNFSDILGEDIQEKLIEKNVILIPHGSFVEYVGAKEILNLEVPIFGNKRVLEWESDRRKSFEWFERAKVKTPEEFRDPGRIDRRTIVKYGGAGGGRGYKLVKSEKEFVEKIGNFDSKRMFLQEYIIGTRFYPSFFYSPLTGENELLGMDIRYESNVDGLSRLPANNGSIEPSYVVTGNLPVVMRESLLPEVYTIADRLIETSRDLFPPGLTGPYCLEMVCTEDLNLYLFEISARIVAGTNVWVPAAPYAYFRHGEPMYMGRRIAREIKNAERENRIAEIMS